MGASKKGSKKKKTPKRASDPAAKVTDVEHQIQELRRKIRVLEEQKVAAEFARTPLAKNLRATQTALAKAVADMDARANLLSAEFIRASRQYLTLLDRAIEEALGKRRRGRKPKIDL